MYINIFQKLRVLRDKFDRQNNYTRVPHFPVIIPDDFPHIFFFPFSLLLKLLRFDANYQRAWTGEERKGEETVDGKEKGRRGGR